MQPLEDTVRFLRFVHVVLLVSIVLYAFVAEILDVIGLYNETFFLGFLAVAVVQIGVVLFFRARMVGTAAVDLRIRPEDGAALNRWRAGNMTVFVLCEAVALLGLALRVVGGPFEQASIFYATAFFLMLISFPRNPAN